MQMAHSPYITLEKMHLERLIAQKCIAAGNFSHHAPYNAILKQRHAETPEMNREKWSMYLNCVTQYVAYIWLKAVLPMD